MPIDKKVPAYQEKLRKCPSPLPLKLTNTERMKYTFKSPFPQEFSLPSNIIYYIAKNPSFPNGHLKLISTCKFLLRMSKILPVKYAVHENDKDDCNKWIVNDDVLIPLTNKVFKLWIDNYVSIWTESLPNLASTLVKNVYKFSVSCLFVTNQVLTFKELQILVSGGHLEDVYFCDVVIKNDDESIIEFEKVFELLCCKEFKVWLPDEEHGIGKITADKLIEILSSDQLPPESDISLINIPESFDISSFSEFLKINMTTRQHKIDLEFVEEISDDYKNQLEQFYDELSQIPEIYAHTVPFITFLKHVLNFTKCEMK